MEPLGDYIMTLKLPSIQRRGIQRLATPDPMLPVREAGSRAAMFNAIGGAASTVAGLASQYMDREAKRELRDASLSVHEADRSFLAANKNKEEFDLDKTEDEDLIEIAEELGVTEGIIPAHRVYAELRKRKYDNSVKAASDTIGFSRTREEFDTSQTAQSATYYAQDASQATQDQIGYIAKKTMAKVDRFILDRDFTGARLEVGLSTMSSTARASAMTDINKREQVDYFSEAIENRSIPAMQTALKQLSANDKKTTSELNAKEQKVLANQLHSAIGTEKNAIKAGVNSQLKLNTSHLRNQIDDSWGNQKVDLEDMQKNMGSIRLTNPVLYEEAEWTLNNQPLVSSILEESPEEQAAIYKHAKETTGGNMEKSYLVDKLGKAIEDTGTAFRTDAMKKANETGLIVLEPMDYSTPEATGLSFAKRVKHAITIQDKQKAYTGYLTIPELSTFGNRIENSSVEENLALFGSISKNLGEYAPALYSQLEKYGIAGTAALAGQLIGQGPEFRVVAENILRGAELRRTDKVTQLKIKDADLDATIVQKFGMMYAGNQKYKNLMANAFKDVWAMTGDSTAAFEQLTGGSVEYNGAHIQAPAPGVGGIRYAWHMRNIDKSWWAGEGMKAHGYSPTQLRAGVIDGSLKQIGMEAGINHLVKPNGDIVTKPDGVTPLPFAIDMSEPTRMDVIKAKHGKERAKVEAAMKIRKDKAKAEHRDVFLRTYDAIGGPRKMGEMP